MEQLHLSQSNFYRLRNACFQEEKIALSGISQELLKEKFAVAERKLAEIGDYALHKLAYNESVDGATRLGALHLASEIAVASAKIYSEGPSAVSQMARAYPQALSTTEETVQKHLLPTTLMKNNNDNNKQQQQQEQEDKQEDEDTAEAAGAEAEMVS